MRPPIELVEHGSSKTVELSASELEVLRELEIVTAKRSSTGKYTLKPKNKVGSVNLGDLQLNVRPKVTELNRLLFFIGYYSNPAIWRDEFVRLSKAPGLYPAIAESFVRLTARAIQGGLMQGYQTKTDSLAVVRGRVQFREQIMRNYGLPLPIAVEYDDFTTDVLENQVVLLAIFRLLGMPEIGADARQQLSRLRWLFDEITMLPNRNSAPKCSLGRANTRYHDILQLSEVILDNSSFDQHAGSLAVSGFVFDMAQIFESFVTGAIDLAMRQFGGRAKLQPDKYYLDKESTMKIRPDLVWCDVDDVETAVIDAKYKTDNPREDLYQMISYCSVLGLPEGHLVYARSNVPLKTHEIKTCGITIHRHALDLSKEPNELLKDIDKLARDILHK